MLCRAAWFCGFLLLAAGDLAVAAAVYLGRQPRAVTGAKYAKFCRGELLIPRFFAVTAPNMLNFASRRQPLAARIDKIPVSGARRNFMAELRKEF